MCVWCQRVLSVGDNKMCIYLYTSQTHFVASIVRNSPLSCSLDRNTVFQKKLMQQKVPNVTYYLFVFSVLIFMCVITYV